MNAVPFPAVQVAWFSNFSCLDAKCYKPSDRAMLLAKIRDEWGSEEEFDEFVRTELVDALSVSKAEYQGQLLRIVAESIELIMGD